MHITDIADAMIVGRLFKALFESQVVVVTTSNVHPRDLYKNGLNRPLFLPFIDLIADAHGCGGAGGRQGFPAREAGRQAALFHARRRQRQGARWIASGRELTGGQPGAPLALEVKGRKLTVPQAAMGVARFSFDELCGQPLGTVDYLALAHKFHTLFIDGIPVLSRRRDVARRFINLIDTLYDTRIGLVVSAAAEPDGLYPAGDVRYLFERTVSRLIEMRSETYLAARSERLAAPRRRRTVAAEAAAIHRLAVTALVAGIHASASPGKLRCDSLALVPGSDRQSTPPLAQEPHGWRPRRRRRAPDSSCAPARTGASAASAAGGSRSSSLPGGGGRRRRRR